MDTAGKITLGTIFSRLNLQKNTADKGGFLANLHRNSSFPTYLYLSLSTAVSLYPPPPPAGSEQWTSLSIGL